MRGDTILMSIYTGFFIRSGRAAGKISVARSVHNDSVGGQVLLGVNIEYYPLYVLKF
jgi:hypothetical protein